MKKNRTFSSLKPIRSLLPDNVKKLIKNKPSTSYNDLKKSWSKILGNQIARKCELTKVNKFNGHNSIFLKVDRKDLIDIDYSRDEIINKINAYLGYNFVTNILINIEDNKGLHFRKKSLNLNKRVENLLNNIGDAELKHKLKNFTFNKDD